VYIPAAFREADLGTLHALIRANNFGTLVSHVDGELFATHLPFLLDSERGPYGTLIAHLARPNPHWHSFLTPGRHAPDSPGHPDASDSPGHPDASDSPGSPDASDSPGSPDASASPGSPDASAFRTDPDASDSPGGRQVSDSRTDPDAPDPPTRPPSLAMFMGPHAYISPRWYATELSVPTWNYTVVHAYGVPSIVDDPERVREILDRIVRSQEEPPPAGWSPAHLPADFVTRMAHGVVAFELEITRLEGKWKLGQNRPSADVEGATAGLRATGEAVARDVADLMTRPRWPA
jgi:transcriptional regulator